MSQENIAVVRDSWTAFADSGLDAMSEIEGRDACFATFVGWLARELARSPHNRPKRQ